MNREAPEGRPEGVSGSVRVRASGERPRGSSEEASRERDASVLCGKRMPALYELAIYIMESLILAQNERWRRVLSMQVERYEEACFFREWRTGE